MSDDLIHDLKQESAKGGKDKKTRTLLLALTVLWLITLLALVGVSWQAYFQQKEKALTLAQQVALACRNNDFGPDFNVENRKALCSNAKKVIKNQKGVSNKEVQESEIQEREIQEKEIQERENQERDRNDPEIQDSEAQDSENDDPEIQDPEIDDPEVQDPEIDDPDPASPYDFSFTFSIPSEIPMGQARTYKVNCNSGSGKCTVSEVV